MSRYKKFMHFTCKKAYGICKVSVKFKSSKYYIFAKFYLVYLQSVNINVICCDKILRV